MPYADGRQLQHIGDQLPERVSDNLSNFYRHFKKVIGIIPKELQEPFLKNQS